MHLVEVQEQMSVFEKRGLRVVAVGQATGEEASAFCEEWGVHYPCLGDPRRNGYKALGLRRGNLWNVVLRGVVTKPIQSVSLIAKTDMKGAQLDSTDVLQLGGIFIVDRTGTLRGRHRAASPEDMPPPGEVAEFATEVLAGENREL
jgi:peroxiredoxin